MRILLLTLVAAAPAVAEDYLVTPAGIWRIEGGVPTAVTTSEDRVFFIGGPSTPQPPDQPDPPADLFGQVKSISRDVLQNEQEATGLVSVVRLLLRDDADVTKLREGLVRSIEVLAASPIFPGNQFSIWLQRIEGLNPEYDIAFMELLDSAVSEAFGIKAGEMETKDDVEQINITALIDLIKLILELLKNLGILDANAVFKVTELEAESEAIPITLHESFNEALAEIEAINLLRDAGFITYEVNTGGVAWNQ